MEGDRKSSEIKSGNLILVSGTFLRKLQQEDKKPPKSSTNHDALKLLRQKQKINLLSKKNQKSPRRVPRSPRRGVLCGRSPVKKAVVPKMVRLVVHGGCRNDPDYLVVYESSKRFARPVACLKMRDCRVTTDYYDVTKFTLVATSVGVTFVLKARSHEACKSWVKALIGNSPVFDKKSGFKNRKKLPPVVEEKI